MDSDFAWDALFFGSSPPCGATWTGGRTSHQNMKHVLLAFLTTLLIVAMTLSAMIILVRTTLYVTSITSPLPRAGAVGAELLLGVVLLLGTVWLATHLAVLIFAPKPDATK